MDASAFARKRRTFITQCMCVFLDMYFERNTQDLQFNSCDTLMLATNTHTHDAYVACFYLLSNVRMVSTARSSCRTWCLYYSMLVYTLYVHNITHTHTNNNFCSV